MDLHSSCADFLLPCSHIFFVRAPVDHSNFLFALGMMIVHCAILPPIEFAAPAELAAVRFLLIVAGVSKFASPSDCFNKVYDFEEEK